MNFKEALTAVLPYAILANLLLLAIKIDVPYNMLFRLIPISLLAAYFLLIAFLIYNFAKIKSQFGEINKKTWILLCLIILLGFSLRMFIAPHAHRVFFDEDIYLNIAQNIKNEMKSCLCDYGTPQECYRCIPNKQPHAYSAFISIFFFIFGANEPLAHNITIVLGTLSILLVFATTYLLFGKQSVSLYSSLILALIPEHIRWSATTSLEAFFVFFTLLSIFLLLLYCRTQSYPILAAAIFALAIALQGRPEADLLIILAALLFLLFDKRLAENFKSPKFFLAILLLAILILPSAMHLKKSSSDSWGSSGEKISLHYFSKNASDNSKFFFENTRFPALFTILSIVGIAAALFSKNKKELLLILAWFFLFFGIYAVFYAGSFNYGTDVRFSLSLYPPVAMLAAMGLGLLEQLLAKIKISPPIIKYHFLKLITKKEYFDAEKPEKKHLSVWPITIILLLLAVLSALPFFKHISIYGEEAWDAKAVHDFAAREAEKIRGRGCYVFSHTPSLFMVNGANSLQTYLHEDKRIADEVFKKTDCVFFYEGYWCVNVLAHKNGICRMMHENFELTPYATLKERNKVFTFYTVKRKK